MTDLEQKFQKYISKVQNLKYIEDENKLYLYGNYKQIIYGDININKPSFLDIKEYKKWNAWNNCKGIKKEKAMRNYINRVKELFLN